MTELMCLYQDDLSNGCCLLAVLIRLNMLTKLRHNSTELQVELAEVTVRLQLGAEVIMSSLSISNRLVSIFRGRLTNTVILVEVIGINCTLR